MASGKFVSRGGDKLQFALDEFHPAVKGKVVLDVGSSTGGFVDCLLQNGAAKVYALDTSYGELAWKIRCHPHVVVLERTNILHFESLPEDMDLVTVDAGWTRLELVLPRVRRFLKPEGRVVALLKPQYEASQHDLIKGIVPKQRQPEIKRRVIARLEQLGFRVESVVESPILGGSGNREYLTLLKDHIR